MIKTVKPAAANSGHRTKMGNECRILQSSTFLSPTFYPQTAAKSTILWTKTGKVAGIFNPRTRVFAKHCRHEHILRKPPAVAYDASVVAELNRFGCRTLRVVLEDGTVLSAPFSTLLDYGFELDRGHGRQIALPLTHWSRENPAQFALPLEVLV